MEGWRQKEKIKPIKIRYVGIVPYGIIPSVEKSKIE